MRTGGRIVTNGACDLPPLTAGRLVRRYKRFLADVILETGETVTAHCPNSGSMKGCADPGATVYLSESRNPGRKLLYTWELIQLPATLAGINTQLPNRLVKKSIEAGLIPELAGYERVLKEVQTSAHSRLDLLLEGAGRPLCYVEIKNCTLVENGTALFPDAVTQRGQKHLEELEKLVSMGHRGVIFYLIQRMDAVCFAPADGIDRIYGEKLRQAAGRGVETLAMDTVITRQQIKINRSLPVRLD